MIAYTHLEYRHVGSAFVGFWAAQTDDGSIVGESLYMPGRGLNMYDVLRIVVIPAFNHLVDNVVDGSYHQLISTSAAFVCDLGDAYQVRMFSARRSPPWVLSLIQHTCLHNAVRPILRSYKSYPVVLRETHDLFLDRALRLGRKSIYAESIAVDVMA